MMEPPQSKTRTGRGSFGVTVGLTGTGRAKATQLTSKLARAKKYFTDAPCSELLSWPICKAVALQLYFTRPWPLVAPRAGKDAEARAAQAAQLAGHAKNLRP